MLRAGTQRKKKKEADQEDLLRIGSIYLNIFLPKVRYIVCTSDIFTVQTERQIATVINDAGGNFATGVVDTGGK